jgi:hypothetical protein
MQKEIEQLVDRAVDRLVDGIERTLATEGRFVVLEKDSASHEDGIKYLRTQLHEVRSGNSSAPGLNQLNMTNRELTMEVNRLKENDVEMTRSLKELAEIVGDLKAEGKLQTWKVGAIIAVLVYLANLLSDKIKIF